MIKDLFYKLFKRSKVNNLDLRVSALENNLAKTASVSVEALDKNRDNYDLIFEMQKEIQDLKSKLYNLHEYVLKGKWDTKH
jgi:hypothetical protein